MGWQEITVLCIVAGTASAFIWQRFRRRRPQSNPCGCAGPERAGQGPSIIYRARKGERPEVVIKFK